MEDAPPVGPGDASPARAQGVDVQRGQGDSLAAEPVFLGYEGLAALDESDIEAGPAHVGDDVVLDSVRSGHPARGDGGRGRTREQGGSGPPRGDGGGHDPAVGAHDEEGAPEAESAKRAVELLQIFLDDGTDIGVEGAGAHSLKEANLGQEFRGDGQKRLGERFAYDLGRPLFVLRIRPGVHEAKGDRLGALRPEPQGLLVHTGLVEGFEFGPGLI